MAVGTTFIVRGYLIRRYRCYANGLSVASYFQDSVRSITYQPFCP